MFLSLLVIAHIYKILLKSSCVKLLALMHRLILTYLDPSRTLEAAVTTVNSSLSPILTRQARNVLPLEEPHSSIRDTTPTLYDERSGMIDNNRKEMWWWDGWMSYRCEMS